ncbi:MAG: SAF domain-containing protein [Propioniciclava sp.]
MSRTPRRLRRFLYLRRRTLAAVAAGLAVLATLHVLTPPEPDLVPVVAATRELPAGTSLAAADLTVIALPADRAPQRALSRIDDAVGTTVNGPVSAMSPITEASVAQGASLAAPGRVIVTLPLADATLAPLVQPGVHLDLIDPADGSLVAADVRVVSVPQTDTGGLLGETGQAALVEVTPKVAATLAVTAQTGGIAIALR